MPTLTPVDFDPFAKKEQAAGPKLTPVDYDPFAAKVQPKARGPQLTPVEYDPFKAQPAPQPAPTPEPQRPGLFESLEAAITDPTLAKQPAFDPDAFLAETTGPDLPAVEPRGQLGAVRSRESQVYKDLMALPNEHGYQPTPEEISMVYEHAVQRGEKRPQNEWWEQIRPKTPREERMALLKNIAKPGFTSTIGAVAARAARGVAELLGIPHATARQTQEAIELGRQLRVADHMAKGDFKTAAKETLATTVLDSAANLWMIRQLTGMLPGAATSTGVGWKGGAIKTIQHAMRVAAVRAATIPGSAPDRVKAAGWGFLYMATPVLSSYAPSNLTAVGADILLNSGVSAIKGEHLRAIEDAQAQAKRDGKENEAWKYAVIKLAPIVGSDVAYSLFTRSARAGNDPALLHRQMRKEFGAEFGSAKDMIAEIEATRTQARTELAPARAAATTIPSEVGKTTAAHEAVSAMVAGAPREEAVRLGQKRMPARPEDLAAQEATQATEATRERATGLETEAYARAETPIEPGPVSEVPRAEEVAPEVSRPSPSEGVQREAAQEVRVRDTAEAETTAETQLRGSTIGVLASTIEDQLATNADKYGTVQARTGNQNKAIHALERYVGAPDEAIKRLKLAVTHGRTDSSRDFSRAEAATYLSVLRRHRNRVKSAREMPVLTRLQAEFGQPGGEADPVLRGFDIALDEEKSRRQVAPEDVKPGEFLDVDRSLYDAEERSDVPVGQQHARITRIDRDIKYEVAEEVRGLFDAAGVRPKDIVNNPEAEARIFNYLTRDERAANMTDQEVRLADGIRDIFRRYEPLVKRIRHERWMRTGELSPDATEKMMQEGQRIRDEEGPAAYDAWLDAAPFGVRELYAPTRHRANEPIRHVLQRMFGRGQTKVREAEDVSYDPENPLIGSLYRYMLKSERIMRMEPELKDLESLFKESGMQPGLMGRYFDNMYGTREPLSKVQKVAMGGMRQFFRVKIPQLLLKWGIRNRLQSTAFTLPKVFSPFDRIFWRNLPKMYSAWTEAGGTKAMLQRVLPDPKLRDYYARYVSSLDAARTHFFMQEFSDFDPIRGLNGMLDTISKAYGWTDTCNRLETFLYGYSSSQDALSRYQANPTKRNWKRFLGVTGARFAPLTEQQQIARLVDAGNLQEASFIAAKRLADSTQFRYPRSERGLLFQKVGSPGHVAVPIATFWKGTLQNLWKDGLQPVMRGLKAEAMHRGTPWTLNRAMGGAAHLLGWYGASLAVNQVMEEVYGIDEGTYGLGILRYTPGGPVIEAWRRASTAVWGAMTGEKGKLNKLISVADDLGRGFLPFYHVITRWWESASGRDRVGPLKEMKRVADDWLAKQAGELPPRDKRRWVERTGLEMVQRVFLDGAWNSRKDDVADAYYKALTEENPEKREHRWSQLEEELRKYPVSTARKDIPRTAENIEALVPGINRDIGDPSRR